MKYHTSRRMAVPFWDHWQGRQWGCATIITMDLEGYRRGIQLFNRAAFFEAHEVLEEVWRVAPEPERKFLQGLIQIAVAFHHHSTGNLVGARSLLERATRNLAGYPENFAGVELTTLRQAVAHWGRALAAGEPVPPLLRLELRNGG